MSLPPTKGLILISIKRIPTFMQITSRPLNANAGTLRVLKST